MNSLSTLEATCSASDSKAILGQDVDLSWKELGHYVAGAMAWLEHKHVKEGDIVTISPKPRLPDIIWMLAAIEYGAPLLLLHPHDSPAKHAIGYRQLQPFLTLPSFLPPKARMKPRKPPDHAMPLAYVFTSGTSAQPKVAILSRKAFLCSVRASEANLGTKSYDRWLLSLPLAHVGGFSILLRTLVSRRTMVLPTDRSEKLYEHCSHYRVTLLSMVPTMLQRALRSFPSFVPSIRAILLGGSSISPSLVIQARERGFPIVPTYGLTEMCGQVSTQSLKDGSIPDDVGRALQGVQLRLRDSQIDVKGPSLFDGYVGQQSPFLQDGWFPTGDRGMILPNGRVRITERMSDLIITGGENVSALYVESIFLSYPNITNCCVVGMPDSEWGEIVVSVFETCAEPKDIRAILIDAKKHLSRYEYPKMYVKTGTLPANYAGKIDRAKIKHLLHQYTLISCP